MSVDYVSSTPAGQHIAPITTDHGIHGFNLSPHVVEKMKNLHRLFNQGTRRTCDNCATKQVSWSCVSCDRHLPNGTWAELGLPAEDEEESIFGRLRQVVQSGLVGDEDQHTFAYEQVQYVLKFWIIEEVSAPLDLPVMKDSVSSLDALDPAGWKWANVKLSAEDSSASIMGVLRSLSRLGLIEPHIVSGWTQFGRSLAKCWAVLESVLDGTIARTPLPAALANELERYHESAAPKPMSRALADGLCKYSNLSMADFDGQPPVFSEFGAMLIDHGCSIHQVSIASSKKKETPRFTVGPPPKKYLKEVAKAVEANNKSLDEERARKEQAKKDRQAKKDEAATKKARAQEDQRKARQRKAEGRKQAKLQHTETKAKIRGPSGSSQPLPASPVVINRPHEDSTDITEPEPVDNRLANAALPSLENVVEIAPAAGTNEDGAFATSSSDSNTLVDGSASGSVTKTCYIDTAEDCQCDECLKYDLAIDMLEVGSPDEPPSQPENSVELLSSKPRSSRSDSIVSRLEYVASSIQTGESQIPTDKAPENAFASQHSSIDEVLEGESRIPKDNALENTFTSQHNSIDDLIEGTRPKLTLNVSAPPFVPKVDPAPSQAQQHTYRLPGASELPNWFELGLTAEAADDSLFSRVWQLKALGALTFKDKKDFGTIIAIFWKQMYLATQDSPSILKTISWPKGSGSWSWSDYQLSAEDSEDSIFGVSKKLALLGFWSICDDKALHDITLRVAKKWFHAISEEYVLSNVVAEPVLDPERNARRMQNTPSTASTERIYGFAIAGFNTTGPLPGLYRNGRMVSS